MKRKRSKASPERRQRSPARLRGSSDAAGWLAQAHAHWAAKRFPEAIEAFRKAAGDPQADAATLADAARALGARYEFAEAFAILERLDGLAAASPQASFLAAQTCRMIGRRAAAIERLEAVAAGAKSSTQLGAHSRLELALLYERGGRLDDAARLLDDLGSVGAPSAEVRLIAGRISRRLGNDTHATQALQSVAADRQAHPLVRAQALHELALVHEGLGEPDEAWLAVERAKRVLSPAAKNLAEQRDRERESLNRLVDSLSQQHIAKWSIAEPADPASQRKVAWLTGPPRAGTTLLEKVLDAHPEVTTADEEVAFPQYIFPAMVAKRGGGPLDAADLDAVPAGRLAEQRARYLRYIEGATDSSLEGRLLLDKNPSILRLVPGMLRLFPNSRFLIAQRDPRDVAVSCYLRYLPLNTVSADFLTLEGVATRLEDDFAAWQTLKPLLPSDRWAEVRYESMVDDFEQAAGEALRPLGLEWDPMMSGYRNQLSARPANSPTYEAVSQPIHRQAVQRWKRYERRLAPVMERLTHLAQRMGYE